MTTISNGSTTVTPALVTGYEAEQEARTVIHPILGRAAPDYTLAPLMPRAGELECLFQSKSDAFELRAALGQPAVFTLVDTDHPELNMSFVVDDVVRLELEDETRALWLLIVGFQEVLT